MEWFSVDHKGLAQILARKGVAHILHEIVANAFDEEVKNVVIELKRLQGTKLATMTVTDDSPKGFETLSSAWTLFAPSSKKGKVHLRGRFNAGEKFVLAISESASIASTTGTVVFDQDGRHLKRSKTDKGSIFKCTVKLTDEQLREIERAAFRLIPPLGVYTTFNGEVIPARKPIATIEASLQTELADDEGFLRRSQRRTTLEVFDVLPGEAASIFELGIPVVETGDRFHVSVCQKVPLDMERTGPSAAYLSKVRALVLEATHKMLGSDDATSPWVRDALHSHGESLPVEAIRRVTHLRFGEKICAFDPSDPEANNIAVSQGYKVVHGGSLSGSEWAAVKRSGGLLPAGQLTPSPRPYAEGGKPLNLVDRDKWSPSMVATVEYFKRVSKRLLKHDVDIAIASEIAWPFAATYGSRSMVLNLGRLGHRWFDGPLEPKNTLLLHELAHEGGVHHLESAYHEALTALGARMTQLALDEPEIFALERRTHRTAKLEVA